MERADDVQLIHDILSGDDTAFSTLVQKYQKSVHALAWRKIGDFHIAEEITQDTFLQAYQKLSTLKNPNLFAGWLYVIANRLCISWMRRQKPAMKSLDNTSTEEIDRLTYQRYISEQRETATIERRSAIVEKLLEKLPESERTVVTLHYLGEMPTKEIGRFLGVSVKTIHSRLYRARNRLRKEEELLVREILGSVPLPSNLTENIMRHVADMKPIPPSTAKPLLPWIALGAAVGLIAILLAASNRHLTRFQKPYSFEAASERTIEIIDASIVLDIDSKPDVRNQMGRNASVSENSSPGSQTSQTRLASNTQTDADKFFTSQWIQTNRPYGGKIYDILVTSEKNLYAAAPTGIYRLEADATTWTRINTDIPIAKFRMPMAEHANTLYIVSTDEIFTSTNNGETWNVLCPRPKGHPIGLIITDEAQAPNSHRRIVMYLAIQNKGVFRSTDAGAQWDLLENGLVNTNIYALAGIGNIVFAGTNEGLYRLNLDVWQQLPGIPPESIYALTGFGNDLYIATGSDHFPMEQLGLKQKKGAQIGLIGNSKSNRIFHSTDLGATWTEIIPENASGFMSLALDIVIYPNTGEKLLPQGVVAVDENTFYRASPFGIHRTTDAGASLHPFMNGIIGTTTIRDLAAINNRLYARTGTDLVQSNDGGETWETVRIDTVDPTLKTIEKLSKFPNFSLPSQLATAGNMLYGIAFESEHLRVFHLSEDNDVLVPVQGMPIFQREPLYIELKTKAKDAKQAHLPNNPEKLDETFNLIEKHSETGVFATSGHTFYLEHKRRLFRWKLGDPEWTDTGLIDTSEPYNDELDTGFKLAVSTDTVYVGKRNGKLFQSLDSGNNWRDITPSLPLRFTRFNEIVFVNATVYVATDKGVLTSQNREHWHVIANRVGERIVIDKFAVDGTTVYGTGDTGLYRLDTRRKWEQMLPSVPDTVISLVVNKDKLYIATQSRGMFHIPLENEYTDALPHK